MVTKVLTSTIIIAPKIEHPLPHVVASGYNGSRTCSAGIKARREMILEQVFPGLPREFVPLVVPVGILLTALLLSIAITYMVSLWLIYTKADRAGCLALIPVANAYVLLRISGLPRWSFLLLFLPPINLLLLTWMWLRLGRAFGHGLVFGLGLIVLNPVFVPLLAFDEKPYRGSKIK